MTKVTAVTCPKCGDTIYSRAPHDHRYCSCHHTFVDGGMTGFSRFGSKDIENIKTSPIQIPFTKDELYKDWCSGEDKLGIVRDEK